MALSSSESSYPKRRSKYDVFLSFRGEDTRVSIVYQLYTAFWQKGIITFRDDDELDRGEAISHYLEAIERCRIAIVILSPNYASSTRCLDELRKILQSKKALGLQVFPVFYGVDPSDVRHQKGTFLRAFMEHERFGEDIEKIYTWRLALMEIASISGWNSKDHISEVKLIEEIVETVWKRLQPILPDHNGGLVGIESKITEMLSLLRLGLRNVQFIGIWGMGGIGKTTLARVVYERICSQFDCSCFLTNVCQYGLAQLQENLLSHLKLGTTGFEKSFDFELRKKAIRQLLCNEKVLIVLDGVDDIGQLENLAGNHDWFGPGSRVIVTTRDKHLLNAHGISEIYNVALLNRDESMKLFSLEAFRSDQPPTEYLEMSRFVVSHAGGHPLALKVFGSFLFRRSRQEWECALDEIKKVPDNIIIDTLKISYYALDEIEKETFLDIACFFKGLARDYVIQTLRNCSFDPSIAIQVLLDKSLVSYDGKVLAMHDLPQQMGRNIVWQESPREPGERSRLWLKDDIDHVLCHNTGTDAIRGIVLKLPEPCEVQWDPNAFLKLLNLQLLICKNLHLPRGLNCLPLLLRVLEWDGYPLKALPHVTELHHLVDLKLHHSKIQQLWNGKLFSQKLKSIDLSHSKDLIETPDFSGVPNLERLILEGCTSLAEVHPSLGQLKNLKILNLFFCGHLKKLPNTLEQLSNLQDLNIRGTRIRKMPQGMGRLRKLRTLTDFNVGIKGSKVSEMAMLSNIETLGIRELQNLINPKDAVDAKLKAKNCLLDLSLLWNSFPGPKKLEDSPQVNNSEVLENLQPPKELHKLQIFGYPGTRFPNWMWDFSCPSLQFLVIRDCRNCSVLPPLGNLPSLKELKMAGLYNVRSIGLEFYGNTDLPFKCLEILRLLDMPNWIEWIPSQGKGHEFLRLRDLRLWRCPRLVRYLPKHLPSLKILEIYSCNELVVLLPKKPDNCQWLINSDEKSVIVKAIESSEPMTDIANVSHGNDPQSQSQEPIMPVEENAEGPLPETGATSIHHGNPTAFSDPPDTTAWRSYFNTLKILDESELKELPTRLGSLIIVECHSLESLPEKLIKECPELFDLQMIDCHSLKYFGDGRYPAPLRTLYIDKCRNLQFLPPPEKMRNFEFLERLENLSIGSSCVDSLKSFPLNLFPKLKTLCLWDCPNLESFSMIERFHDIYLPLESLEIRDCPKLVSFPAKGLRTPNLVSFTISNCEILKSLPNEMTALKSLRSLFILTSPQLESIPEGGLPSSLNLLSIAFCNKLLPKKEWDLKRLDSLSRLEIESGCLTMKSFPDAELLPPNLNSLRISNLSDLAVLDYRGLQDLTALESMEIDGCHKLSSLPNEGLPSSLTFLSIKDSPMLTQKLLPESGAEWHKIAHIPSIEIDGNII